MRSTNNTIDDNGGGSIGNERVKRIWHSYSSSQRQQQQQQRGVMGISSVGGNYTADNATTNTVSTIKKQQKQRRQKLEQKHQKLPPPPLLPVQNNDNKVALSAAMSQNMSLSISGDTHSTASFIQQRSQQHQSKSSSQRSRHHQSPSIPISQGITNHVNRQKRTNQKQLQEPQEVTIKQKKKKKSKQKQQNLPTICDTMPSHVDVVTNQLNFLQSENNEVIDHNDDDTFTCGNISLPTSIIVKPANSLLRLGKSYYHQRRNLPTSGGGNVSVLSNASSFFNNHRNNVTSNDTQTVVSGLHDDYTLTGGESQFNDNETLLKHFFKRATSSGRKLLRGRNTDHGTDDDQTVNTDEGTILPPLTYQRLKRLFGSACLMSFLMYAVYLNLNSLGHYYQYQKLYHYSRVQNNVGIDHTNFNNLYDDSNVYLNNCHVPQILETQLAVQQLEMQQQQQSQISPITAQLMNNGLLEQQQLPQPIASTTVTVLVKRNDWVALMESMKAIW
mmetsp:Transcript_44790/g.53850  ORF Transcript_44790/g.53850 Transcript_44790/m.53850 type:complete len:501 (+) Transcript_44790:106-1608(+)